MKKNYILAFVLSFAVLMSWQYFIARTQKPISPSAPEPSSSGSQGPSSTAQEVSSGPVLRDSRLVLDVGLHRISVNRFGGGIAQWEIKEGDRWLTLVPEKDFTSQPLACFPDLEYTVRQEGSLIVMSGKRPDGLAVTKTLNVSETGFLHTLDIKLTNNGSTPLKADYEIGWGPGIEAGDEGDKDGRQAKAFQRALVFENGKVRKLKPGTESGVFQWWGVDGHYFLAAFVNPSPAAASVRVEKQDRFFSVREMVSSPLSPKETKDSHYSLYLGPKGYEPLKSFGWGLEQSVDFGYFAPFGRVIHRALFLFHKATGNYGWAIILLTAIIQILVLPLTVKSFQHAQKMKNIQPQMKRLQELYKNDARRLNSEMLALYQRHGLRFMGMEGCVPMLIQLPVFWALFSTLRNTFELRHAPWIGWVKDLSVHDPVYALPLLMGVGMFFQQRMTLNTADATQKQMMYMMPIIFTFFFLKMPSGLVIYWLTNSLLTIGIQAYLKRRESSAVVVQ